MYKVVFSSSVVAEFEDVIKACSLALNLHQFSNVDHSVVVYAPSGDVVCSLFTAGKNGNQ